MADEVARVSLTAMVAGVRAQDIVDGSEPTDEWREAVKPFSNLSAAKEWITGLDPRITTHVELSAANDAGEWFTIYRADEGDGTLDEAHVPTVEELAAAEAAAAPPEPAPTPMSLEELS